MEITLGCGPITYECVDVSCNRTQGLTRDLCSGSLSLSQKKEEKKAAVFPISMTHIDPVTGRLTVSFLISLGPVHLIR